jgi:hypothetical protein
VKGAARTEGRLTPTFKQCAIWPWRLSWNSAEA